MPVVTSRCTPPIRYVALDTGRMNILGLDALRELRTALSDFDEEAPVVVLTGRTESFSAGLDLATLSQGGAASQQLLLEMGELLVEIYRGPTRLVVACQGHAVAAGAMLLLVADIRVGAAGNYKVGFSEASQGMPLPDLPVLLAKDRIDPRQLQAVTLLGRLSDPEGAQRAGFLDEVVAPTALVARAEECAHELASLSTPAYSDTIDAVRGATLRRLDALLDQTRAHLARLCEKTNLAGD